MAKTFASPAAFKTSLEARLKTVATQRGLPINTLRLKLIIERLLARLFAKPGQPWVLKGGYAMELRYRPRARTTRDIDLTCLADPNQEHKARMPDPPASWDGEFPTMATEARLQTTTPAAAIEFVRIFWRQVTAV